MSKYSTQIKTYNYDNGEIQRVQVVRFDSFKDLNFLFPEYDSRSFDGIVNLYRDFIINKYSFVFGKIVIFKLDDMDIPFSSDTEDGIISDPLSVVTRQFKKHVKCIKNEITFDDDTVKAFFEKLEAKGDLYVAMGKRNKISFLPIGRHMGFMSSDAGENDLKVNSSFFVMDQLDCGSIFDHVGIPIGLMVKDGKVLNPPQFDREAFLVKNDGKSVIGKVSLKQLDVIIDGVRYSHGKNCLFYERPEYELTQEGMMDLIVVNNKVVAINRNGCSQIPSGGFVVSLFEPIDSVTDPNVTYEGMDYVDFGIQVGNSAVVEGNMTDRFISGFYNFIKFYKTSYPPSMYPLNFKKSRAPRIVIGVDNEGKGMILWFEGAGKFGYVKGEGSCGASLSEANRICLDLGMYNGVHLDGGGSAQILIKGQRELQVSDRDPSDLSEQERAIPSGLILTIDKE